MNSENDGTPREAPHPDGVPLGRCLKHDDTHYSSIRCPSFGRSLSITFTALVDKFGPDIGAVALARQPASQP